jgi:hypothetical protein
VDTLGTKESYKNFLFKFETDFISVNDTFHQQHNFNVDINLSYYYGNMFRLYMVIFRPTEP